MITLPNCCPTHRLAALDLVDVLLMNDTRAAFDRMVRDGWTPSEALEALRLDYRSWLLGRFAEAIDAGLELLELDTAA